MKKIIFIFIIVLSSSIIHSQRVGIGTTTPTHYFHVLPPIASGDPIRIEGLLGFNTETDVLVVDPSSGIIRTMPFQMLLSLDTVYFNDTSYTLIRDSLLGDTIFLDSLLNLLATDDQNIDSVTLLGTILNVYIENGIYGSVDLQPIIDSAIANLSGGTDDQNIDSLRLTGTILTTYIENGTSANIDLQPIIDSALTNFPSGSDNQNLDSLRLNGTIFTAYIENGLSANIDLQPIIDSAISNSTDDQQVNNFSLTGTTLTLEIENDGQPPHTVNLSSLQDGTGTDDQNLDSLRLNGTILTAYIEGGTNANINLQPIIDSAIANSSGGTDDQNIDSLRLTGTILTTYIENGASANIDLQPIIDSAIANSSGGTDDQNIDSIRLAGTILTTYIENGAFANIDLQPIIDSAIANNSEWNINSNGTGLEGIPGSNIASGNNSISAGNTNIASGNNSVVFGNNNNASGNNSVVLGSVNTVSGNNSFISGGELNTVVGNFASAAGSLNRVNGNFSVISGGENNFSNPEHSTIAGGYYDSLTGDQRGSFIGGGEYNFIDSSRSSVIAGGHQNRIDADRYSVISGGDQNTITSISTVIAGGYNNIASGHSSVIGGGDNHITFGDYSTISGGISNMASGNYSTITGGSRDTTLGDHATITGGRNHKASGNYSTVAGGDDNKTIGDYSIASGGSGNISNGNFSFTTGEQNQAQSFTEFVGGSYSTLYSPNSTNSVDPADRLFVMGNGTGSGSRSNALVLYKNGSLEINEAYTLPNVDGIANQVLQTDGSGNVSWSSAVSGTDNQNIDSIRLTGTILTTYIENGTSANIDLQPIIDSGKNIYNSDGQLNTNRNVKLENDYTTNLNFYAVDGIDTNTIQLFHSRNNSLSTYGIPNTNNPTMGFNFFNTAESDTAFIGFTGNPDFLIGSQNALVLSSSIGISINASGNLFLNDFPNTRNDSDTAINFLFTDANGKLLSKDIDSLVSYFGSGDNDWDINANGTGLEGNPGANTASGTNSIAAGDGNVASGNYSVALGSNDTANTNSSVLGGSNNAISGISSSIAGGNNNKIITTGAYSFIGGGENNTVDQYYSAIVGGENNTVLDNYSTIVGGETNLITLISDYSSILGGSNNTVTRSYGSILGGLNNQANGDHSLVQGQNNTAHSYGEIVLGSNSTNYIPSSNTGWVGTDRLFVIGNGTLPAARSNALTLYKSGDLQLHSYPNTRDDRETPLNFLATDATGLVISLPVDSMASVLETNCHYMYIDRQGTYGVSEDMHVPENCELVLVNGSIINYSATTGSHTIYLNDFVTTLPIATGTIGGGISNADATIFTPNIAKGTIFRAGITGGSNATHWSITCKVKVCN